MESNVNSYKLVQNDKQYILTLSIEGNSIKISCKNELEPSNEYIRTLTIENLKKLDSIFDIIKTPLDAIKWIDKALKVQKVQIIDDYSSFKIVFHITTNGITHQVGIPMGKKGSDSTNIFTGTEGNVIQETKIVTKTITEADFNREIGLDPSLIVKQTLNENADQIIKSIEEERRKSLSQINYNLANIYNAGITSSQGSLDINNGTINENKNTFQETSYQIKEETKNIIPEVTTETNNNYEFDLNQITSVENQNNIAQYTESAPELNMQFNTGDNNYITQDISNQFNFEDNKISTTPDIINSQFNETNQITNTLYSNQVPLTSEAENIQTTFESKPYITPADDNIGQIDQIINTETKTETVPLNINIENTEPGFTQENYGEIQTTDLNTQNIINTNTEINTTETQNIINYETQQTGGDTNFQTQENKENEVDSLKNKLDELQILNSKVDELIGLKSQFEEINNLIAQINQINLNKPQNEQQSNNQDNQMEFIKTKIQETEKLIEQYKMEIMNLKENKTSIKESSESEQNQHLFHQRIQQYSVKGEIIHNREELELITKMMNKINKKVIINLLYKATADSDKAQAFHEKCDKAQSSLVLIETDKGKRFGGFTTSSWSGDCIDKKDEDAFIFSLDKMKVYRNIPGEDAIGCYPNFGPIFLGCQIRIYDNAFTKGGTTFEKGSNYETEEDYELTGGDREFNVKEIEVYEVIVE